MYFSPLNTIQVLVCLYSYKKRRKIKKTGKYKNQAVITKTLAGLGTSTRHQKLPFLTLFQKVISAPGIFSFVYRQFYDFSIVFLLHGNLILSSDLDSSSNFTSIIVVRIFLQIFFHFCIIEETQDAINLSFFWRASLSIHNLFSSYIDKNAGDLQAFL